MKKEPITGVAIRKLGNSENTPYDLLLEADLSRAFIDQYLSISEVYIAIVDEMIVGTYVLCPVSPKVVEIKNISVAEQYQGRELGSLLLKDASLKAKEKRYKEIIIGTGNSSVGQLYLYQKEGFDITSIKRNFFIENYPEIIYESGIQVRHMLILTKNL